MKDFCRSRVVYLQLNPLFITKSKYFLCNIYNQITIGERLGFGTTGLSGGSGVKWIEKNYVKSKREICESGNEAERVKELKRR